MQAFRRWLTKPAISIADGLMYTACTLGAEAMKLGWHLPWPAILAIVAGTTTATLFATGFVKGLTRSIRR